MAFYLMHHAPTLDLSAGTRADELSCDVAVIGAGPAGLMAAEQCVAAGLEVRVFDAMPSAGRKFLLAGRGGLNLTHSESETAFAARYGQAKASVENWLHDFGPQTLVAWASDLGIETFVGSSGRVFPKEMKAAPLLRAWLSRLRGQGVMFHQRHRWLGFGADGGSVFATPDREIAVRSRSTVLALGGASWPQLGSNGAWVDVLTRQGVSVAPLRPANCGFLVDWSEHFIQRWAGVPLKNIGLVRGGHDRPLIGEAMVCASGLEGGLVYTHAAALRQDIDRAGVAVLTLDLLPAYSLARVHDALCKPRGAKSWSSQLKSVLNLSGVKAALLRECAAADDWLHPGHLANRIKALAVTLREPMAIQGAISSAGGVTFASLTPDLEIKRTPGVFCAGEMIDWEAPTGGYLLTAAMASGVVAGRGVVKFLA